MASVDGFDEPSRDDLPALLEREWADREALIARAAGRPSEPGARGGWTFKDMIAHGTYCQHFAG